MKKKQRCLLNRFAALVAALMLCASLCVPCFASNNASSKKWVVSSEANLTSESGSVSRYLQLVPYENGHPVPNTFATAISNISNSNLSYVFMCPVNYPDWWRSSIPLGSYSYVGIDNVAVLSYKVDGVETSLSSVTFFPCNSVYSFTFTGEFSSTTNFSLSSPLTGYFQWFDYNAASGITRSVGSSSGTALLQSCTQIVSSGVGSFGVPGSGGFANNPGVSLHSIPALANLSSDNLVFCVFPSNGVGSAAHAYLAVRATISFFVDANKLPAGLQVGDEFPADTDAFDQLRDDLIKQFPEAAENIKNGKATIDGWNNTETVDSDVASTSISALNALFQNLGGFLFIVSLMVFGAVVLRMLIRKAVDG